MRYVVPRAGRLARLTHSRLARTLLVTVPAVLLGALVVWRVWRPRVDRPV